MFLDGSAFLIADAQPDMKPGSLNHAIELIFQTVSEKYTLLFRIIIKIHFVLM
jgi:hypothetical protein